MTVYLLDTNHASRFLDRAEPITSRVESARGSGDEFGVSMTVLGELYYAAYASTRWEKNLARLADFIDDVIVWEFDHTAAEEYGRIQAEQKAKGRKLGALDAQIAAVARVCGLTVLTDDKQFDWIKGLVVENWLKNST